MTSPSSRQAVPEVLLVSKSTSHVSDPKRHDSMVEFHMRAHMPVPVPGVACCRAILEVVVRRRLLPFFDSAYQVRTHLHSHRELR